MVGTSDTPANKWEAQRAKQQAAASGFYGEPLDPEEVLDEDTES